MFLITKANGTSILGVQCRFFLAAWFYPQTAKEKEKKENWRVKKDEEGSKV